MMRIITVVLLLASCGHSVNGNHRRATPPLCTMERDGELWTERDADGGIVASCVCRDPGPEPGTFPHSWVTTGIGAIGSSDWCPRP